MGEYRNEFKPEDIKYTEPAEKVGIAATINNEGLPHISLLTSIQVRNPKELTIGEFCTGLSKDFMERNRKIGFLIMTLGKEFWRGKAQWREKKTHGDEFEDYNTLPMFRYNSYFGINTVHYLDLTAVTDRKPLPMGAIIASTLKTRMSKGFIGKKATEEILTTFSYNLINKINSLSFLSFIAADGYPVVIPVIQACSAGRNRIIFNTSVFSEQLDALKENTTTALLCMNLDMESVLVRGKFRGFRKTLTGRTGTIDLDWVYNSMPPQHRQIFPEVKLEPVYH